MAATVFRAVPRVKNPGTAAAMIAVTTSQVGFREGPNNETAYGRWYPMNWVAWCAIFMSWCAFMAGCSKFIPKHAYTPSGADWFKARNQWHTGKPKVGDIAYFYSASMGRISHVELVCQVNADGSWLSCGGNTNNTGSREGNGVYLQRRTTTRGGGFGGPAYLPAPKPAAAPVALSSAVVPDATHEQVKLLKKLLKKLGYGAVITSTDGYYGSGVQSAVASFHNDHPQLKSPGVKRDVAIGKQGFALLQKLAAAKS